MELTKYSVLLLYPDYLTSNYGEEVYYAFVESRNILEAAAAARLMAWEAQKDYEGVQEQMDWGLLLLIEGHHKDLSWG